MNIAFIISDYNYQGGGQVTANLAEHLQSLGHKVDIIVIRRNEGDLESRPNHFSNIFDLHATGLISGILKLKNIFHDSRYDVIVTIGSYSNLSAGLAKFLSKSSIKLIGSEHFAKSALIGDYTKPILRLLAPLYRFAYSQLNGLVFVSGKLKLEFLKKNTWHQSRCITIYNPVRSFKKNLKENVQLKKASGLTFLGVGVLEPRKRFDLLLKSFSIIAKPNDILLIAGTGSQKKMLENLTKNLGLESQVIFLGYVKDINSLMKNADILVLTSNSEAFGMVLVEGLVAGLQVVSTDCFSGPSEVLGNGRYGFLAEVDNVDSIVSSIRDAIEFPIPQETIHEGASRFSIDSTVDKYLEFVATVTEHEGNLYKPIKKLNSVLIRKKILINISVITQIYRGMSVFTKQIIKELIKNDNYEYIFVSGNDLDQEIFEMILNSNNTYKQINAPLPIFDQIIIPYLIKKYKPDFCWFPANTFPLIMNKRSKYIITIHDLIFLMNEFKIPTFYQKIAKFYRVFNIFIGVKRVQKITSVSKTSMNDLYTRFNISKKIDEQEILYNSLSIEIDTDDNIFKKLNVSSADNYFYSIVGLGQHKNLDFLIESFKRLEKSKLNYKLVITGAFKSKYNAQHKDIIFTPFISEKEKVSLIKNADLFIFPSLAEGFGIPLLEGLFHNPKVLVSDIPIFREIGKEYVKYFDPYNKDFLKKYFNDNTHASNSNHEEAKNYILKKFNMNKNVEKLETIFNEFK